MANVEAESIEEYISKLPEGQRGTTKEIVELLRRQLPGAEEDVKWGIARFRYGDTDISGISARSKFYSIYMPHTDITEKYVPLLGKVDPGKGCIRFKSLQDLDLPQFTRMLQEAKERVGECLSD